MGRPPPVRQVEPEDAGAGPPPYVAARVHAFTHIVQEAVLRAGLAFAVLLVVIALIWTPRDVPLIEIAVAMLPISVALYLFLPIHLRTWLWRREEAFLKRHGRWAQERPTTSSIRYGE